MLQDLASGLVIGLAYALIAVGLSVIFGVLRLINFAHGEFYMLGGLFLYSLMSRGLGYIPALFGAVIGTMLVAALIDWVVLKPLRRSDEITIALATIGLSIFLANIALVIWGPVPHLIPDPLPARAIVLPGGVRLTWLEVVLAAVAVTIIGVLQFVLQRTSAGRQIRAVVQDHDAAALVGLNVDHVYRATFAVGSGFAAVAGGLVGTIFLVYPGMGLQAVLKAFVVVVIGGMGSISGAVAGGVLLGLAEAIGAAWLPSGYKDIVGFVLIVVVLALRPQGLFGTKSVRIR